MSGCWVFVCGPSGAGKDSVIALARTALAQRSDVVFARRVITRAAQRDSDHEPASDEEFQLLRRTGGLAWQWQAHGFDYGISVRYAHQVAWGRIVVVNGSREHAQQLWLHPLVHCVLVSAPPAQLVARLQQRGRDEPAAVAARLARNQRLAPTEADFEIENDGLPQAAGAALCRHLEALAGP
jgi:ribose 1,5-bisphosphokinase